MRAQFVQAKVTTLRDGQRGLQGRSGVETRKRAAGPQMRFRIGLKLKAAFRHRPAQTHGSYHVLQRFARTRMHMHVAGCHQRHTSCRAGLIEHLLPQVVVQCPPRLQRQPEPFSKQLFRAGAIRAHLV